MRDAQQGPVRAGRCPDPDVRAPLQEERADAAAALVGWGTVNTLSAATRPATDFETMPVEDVVVRLDTDLARGLTAAEAAARRIRYGPNRLEEAAGPGPLRRLLAQFHDPLIYVLLLAGLVTLLFGGYVDAGVIGGVVLLNATIGFVQESRARRALDALARLVPVEAVVLRDGATGRIAAEDLVPGDVVDFAAGDRVPADVRLADTHLFEVDESALTGESVPVPKSVAPLMAPVPVADRVNSAYSGTIVTRGSA